MVVGVERSIKSQFLSWTIETWKCERESAMHFYYDPTQTIPFHLFSHSTNTARVVCKNFLFRSFWLVSTVISALTTTRITNGCIFVFFALRYSTKYYNWIVFVLVLRLAALLHTRKKGKLECSTAKEKGREKATIWFRIYRIEHTYNN